MTITLDYQAIAIVSVILGVVALVVRLEVNDRHLSRKIEENKVQHEKDLAEIAASHKSNVSNIWDKVDRNYSEISANVRSLIQSVGRIEGRMDQKDQD